MGTNVTMTKEMKKHYALAVRYAKAVGLEVITAKEGILSLKFPGMEGAWAFTGPDSALFSGYSSIRERVVRCLDDNIVMKSLNIGPLDDIDALSVIVQNMKSFGEFSSWNELELLLDIKGL